jgi:hypothetical protein
MRILKALTEAPHQAETLTGQHETGGPETARFTISL